VRFETFDPAIAYALFQQGRYLVCTGIGAEVLFGVWSLGLMEAKIVLLLEEALVWLTGYGLRVTGLKVQLFECSSVQKVHRFTS